MRENTAIVKSDLKAQEILERIDTAKPNGERDYTAGNYEADRIHLLSYWRAIRKRLWLIISLTLLATTLIAIFMARKPDIYESVAKVEVDLENSNLGVNSSKSSGIVVNNPIYDPAYFATQLQVITSSGLLRRVTKTLDLEHNQDFLNPQANLNRSTWQSLLRMIGLGKKDNSKQNATSEVALVPVSSTVAQGDARENLAETARLTPFVETLQDGLKAEPVKDNRLTNRETRIIEVRYTHADPQIAAKIVNTIADTFVLQNLERKTSMNSTTSSFLQKRVTELQTQIRSGEEQLINYARNNQILSLDPGQNVVVDRLIGLNKQLLEAENERKLAEAAYRASSAPGAAAALAESDAKQVNDVEAKLIELRQKRAQLLVENTSEWPEVKEVEGQIAILENQVNELRAKAARVVLTNLETRYRQTLAREQSLREAFNQQRSGTLTQNEAAINYKIIQQEIETNKNLLDGLLQRSRENDVVLAGTPNNIYVVDYAVTPVKPIGPQRLRGVILGSALSLVIGIVLALFLEYLDDTVHSLDEVEEVLHLPSIALIPSVAGLKSRRRVHRNGNNGLSLDKTRQTSNELMLNIESRSPLAEAYRQLRTSILLSTAGRAPQTLLVVSSVPSEGKTTTAVNTALSLAQTGAKVLIIDADMRRPRLHTIFNTQNDHGLSTALASEMSLAEIHSILEHNEENDLYILPSGPIPPNPAELIGSDQMRNLIAGLSTTFKHIVIDSPPVGSFTDGVLISTMVDGVLLVVQGGKTSRSLVRRTRQILQEVGARVLGVVLNNVKVQPNDYYYQGYYRSYYDDKSTAENVAST